MAKNFKLSNASKSLAANAVVDQFDDALGYVNIYDGTQPASPNTAITTQTILCTMAVDAAFGASSNGVAVTAALSAAPVVATGTATWFRMFTSADAVVADGTVGPTNDYDMTLTSVDLVDTEEISGVTLTYTQA